MKMMEMHGDGDGIKMSALGKNKLSSAMMTMMRGLLGEKMLGRGDIHSEASDHVGLPGPAEVKSHVSESFFTTFRDCC